jgi:hypothetical protein
MLLNFNTFYLFIMGNPMNSTELAFRQQQQQALWRNNSDMNSSLFDMLIYWIYGI